MFLEETSPSFAARRQPCPVAGGDSMPGIAAAVGSQTGGRSQTAGPAGIALLSVAVGVIALFTLLVAVVDADLAPTVRPRRRRQRMPRRRAQRPICRKGRPQCSARRDESSFRKRPRACRGDSEPRRFRWAIGMRPSNRSRTAAGEPKAVRITVHLSNDRTLCALFPGKPNGIAHRSQRRRRAGFRGNCDRRRRLRDDGHSLIGLFAQAAATRRVSRTRT